MRVWRLLIKNSIAVTRRESKNRLQVDQLT